MKEKKWYAVAAYFNKKYYDWIVKKADEKNIPIAQLVKQWVVEGMKREVSNNIYKEKE